MQNTLNETNLDKLSRLLPVLLLLKGGMGISAILCMSPCSSDYIFLAHNSLCATVWHIVSEDFSEICNIPMNCVNPAMTSATKRNAVFYGKALFWKRLPNSQVVSDKFTSSISANHAFPSVTSIHHFSPCSVLRQFFTFLSLYSTGPHRIARPSEKEFCSARMRTKFSCFFSYPSNSK